VDKDADGRITNEEIKESICLSATTNKLSNIQQQAEEYAALIMEELDPEETEFIMILCVLLLQNAGPKSKDVSACSSFCLLFGLILSLFCAQNLKKKTERATTCVKFHAGKNVGLGKDYTIFSLIDGVVSVYPREVQPENPNSYRARKREYFRMRRKRRKAREAGAAANLHERFEQHRHVDLLNGICASKKSKVRFKINDICASKLHLQLHFAIAIAYSPLFAMRIIEKQQ
ncbi:hypothetical protein HN51_046085, partial [Arachis hypogaea]